MEDKTLVNGFSVGQWLLWKRQAITKGLTDEQCVDWLYRSQFHNMPWKKIPMNRAAAGMTQQQYNKSRIDSSIRYCVALFDKQYKESTDANDDVRLIQLKSLFVSAAIRAKITNLVLQTRITQALDVAELVEESVKAEAEAKAEQERLAREAETKRIEDEAKSALQTQTTIAETHAAIANGVAETIAV